MRYIVGVCTPVPSERKPDMLYIVDVSTPTPSERKPYVLYIVGVGTPMPSERKPDVLYIVGVGTPMPSERKFYMPYVVGVGPSIPFQEAVIFLGAVHCGCGHTNAILKGLCKKYGCRNTRGVYMGVWTPMKYSVLVSRLHMVKVKQIMHSMHRETGVHLPEIINASPHPPLVFALEYLSYILTIPVFLFTLNVDL